MKFGEIKRSSIGVDINGKPHHNLKLAETLVIQLFLVTQHFLVFQHVLVAVVESLRVFQDPVLVEICC